MYELKPNISKMSAEVGKHRRKTAHTGIELSIELHAISYVVDIAEGTGTEVPGLHQQHFDTG